MDIYDVIVVGAGHAGCEAALASARLGCRTALISSRRDAMATMPCNPSIGGLAKSHLVVELDALGGEMAVNADCTGFQFRRLNASRGPAVRATRVQCDKARYARRMQAVLRLCRHLDVYEDEVCDLIVEQARIRGVIGRTGRVIRSKAVVLTTGTALQGRIHVGDTSKAGAGDGRPASDRLSETLARLGIELRHFKTGTPPRLLASSIDWAVLEPQTSDRPIPFLSWRTRNQLASDGTAAEHQSCKSAADPTEEAFKQINSPAEHDNTAAKHWNPMFHVEQSPVFDLESELFHVEQSSILRPWTPGSVQRPCFVTRTSESTHRIIQAHLSQSSRYGGYITATGVRYCPSIEDKIVKFPHQPSHPIYLEPEGVDSSSIYVNGASNSFPPEIQNQMIRSIPGLAQAQIRQYGYAIVYQTVDSRALSPTLELQEWHGLYCAGQINGTTGYEEAAAQGFMAGVNAALQVLDRDPFILSRQDAYIGVLIDDLVTKGTDEPYRMFTSRAERRLLLRPDNARYRLLAAAANLGLADPVMLDATRLEQSQIGDEIARLLTCFDANGINAMSRLARPEWRYDLLPEANLNLPPAVIEQIEIMARYQGYIERERDTAERDRANEHLRLPTPVDYRAIPTLRFEAREKLDRVQPVSLGQAARIPGVNPSDISVLAIMLRANRLLRKSGIG